MNFPELHIVDQGFATASGVNAGKSTFEEVERTGLLKAVGPGEKVLITAGSRGIGCMVQVLTALVSAVKQKGATPLILPAMGSHGGGTAAGQREVLEHLGQTQDTLGAPVHGRLDPVEIGEVEGCPVYADRAAVEADHIILVNRIKEHTEFIGEIESGLIKMAVVGLGRIAGAEIMHQFAVRRTYSHSIMTIARVLFKKLRIRGGIAILEDKNNAVRRVEAVPASSIFDREPELLKEARQHHACLPFDRVDVLLVDEIGKNISGAGFDTKVIGRIMNIYEKECERPRITRIVLRDLSEKTGGNAIGIGLADFVHRRVVEKMDTEMTALNSITAVAPEKGRVPITLSSDRKALEAAFRSIGLWTRDTVRMAWITNTADLKTLMASPALAEEVHSAGYAVSEAGFPLPFDEKGELPCLRRFLAEIRRQGMIPVENLS
ncbi:MAG: hypothetical protein CVU64_10490 [Deltaproteobacteria bacterium HGW-Deltaproteobacteria-21]|nr:MAG: hypothetical protein CVU64_10490 [Deltaproteobacteria bacterium HGW-Deltaproteobacteria-21]